ncbi:unnamed protein product, partial [Oppiella nova]
FTLFADERQNDFYITGESYAGKYVPAIAYKIHSEGKASNINLKGIAIGDGLIDPVSQFNYGAYLYQIGLLDENQREYVDKQANKAIDYINNKKYLALETTRRAIHVGNVTFNDGNIAMEHLMADIMQSTKPWVTTLLDANYKVMLYNGQLDIIVAPPLTENFIESIKWSKASQYKSTDRLVWKVSDKDTEVAGYANVKLDGDVGEPLFLTPYIESGRVAEAQKLSQVSGLPSAPNITHYSGFLTVNKEYNSNMFFWYFPALNGNKSAPVLLWLEGGPGSSSVFTQFAQHGPIVLDKNLKPSLREYTWAQEFSVIYIDNPVGAGFSFTDNDLGYATTESDVARDLYSALQQFFTLFADERQNDFYITGESYAGKYVPAIAYKIHSEGKASNINLKGLVIGDGLIDPVSQFDYGPFLYQIGLLDENQRDYVINESTKAVSYINNKKYLDAWKINAEVISNEGSYLKNMTGLKYHYNYMTCTISDEFFYYTKYLGLEATRRALHVGNLTYNDGNKVFAKLTNDLMQSVKPWLTTLMDADYKVILYNGQLDIIVAATLTENFIQSIKWSKASQYKSADRLVWKVSDKDTEVAGYVRVVHNFYQVVIRNGGHAIAFDQPRATLDIILFIIHGSTALFGRNTFLSHSETNVKLDGDVGEPLYLTPYIESGRVVEAQKLSRVSGLPSAPNITHFSGFLTINKEYNSNMFFWYFPALNGNKSAPVLLWLDGGPGASSLFSQFAQHGPIVLDKNLKPSLREYTWAKEFSVIYIDNPVGTGFSFTDNDLGYATTESDVARDLYSALQQFFTLFADERRNDFYITGESYAGKYVPAIAYKIHSEGKTSNIKLKGLAIGNGWVDPVSQSDYGPFLYQIGLLDENQRDYVVRETNKIIDYINNKKYLDASKISDELISSDNSYIKNMTGLKHHYNYMTCTIPDEFSNYEIYLGLESTRNAIHVGNVTFNDGNKVFAKLANDEMQSVKPWLTTLMDADYKVILYNGQLDIIVAPPLTENFIESIKWSKASQYKSADRLVWKVSDKDTEVAGYVRVVHNFYQVIIRNGGHVVAFEQPRATLD